MTDALQKLFGSPARFKLLQIFLLNPKQSFSLADMVKRSHIRLRDVRRELNLFYKSKIIKRVRKASRSAPSRFMLSGEFEHAQALRTLLLSESARGDAILKRIRRAGALKLVILSGVLVGEFEGSLDLLVVGEHINARILRQRVRGIEGTIGKELRYAALDTQDFFYRLNMNDHLLRDVLDYPHSIVLDKLNIGLK